jgi:hypothetical protein
VLVALSAPHETAFNVPQLSVGAPDVKMRPARGFVQSPARR